MQVGWLPDLPLGAHGRMFMYDSMEEMPAVDAPTRGAKCGVRCWEKRKLGRKPKPDHEYPAAGRQQLQPCLL